tara:strand:+ start:588 stop:1034 length:447 start_codon:yes stop_codon:yes gene_type:complete
MTAKKKSSSTTKKKYYVTKNDMILNLQQQLAVQQEHHENNLANLQSEIENRNGAILSLEKDIAHSRSVIKKHFGQRYIADDVFDLCNKLSAEDVSAIMHVFSERMTFVLEENKSGDTRQIFTDTEIDCFFAESGNISVYLTEADPDGD